MPLATPSREMARAISTGREADTFPIWARPSARKFFSSGKVKYRSHSGIHCSPRALSSLPEMVPPPAEWLRRENGALAWACAAGFIRLVEADENRVVPSIISMKSQGFTRLLPSAPVVLFAPPAEIGRYCPTGTPDNIPSVDRPHRALESHPLAPRVGAARSESRSNRSESRCIRLLVKSNRPSLPPVPRRAGNRASPSSSSTIAASSQTRSLPLNVRLQSRIREVLSALNCRSASPSNALYALLSLIRFASALDGGSVGCAANDLIAARFSEISLLSRSLSAGSSSFALSRAWTVVNAPLLLRRFP